MGINLFCNSKYFFSNSFKVILISFSFSWYFFISFLQNVNFSLIFLNSAIFTATAIPLAIVAAPYATAYPPPVTAVAAAKPTKSNPCFTIDLTEDFLFSSSSSFSSFSIFSIKVIKSFLSLFIFFPISFILLKHSS